MLKINPKDKKMDPRLEPIDLLVDTIIGLLEKGTSYARNIANQSFTLLSGLVKESTVDLIVTVRKALVLLFLNK